MYVPYAVCFSEDFGIACNFFDALYAGIKQLGANDIPAVDRTAWDTAAQYLATRR